MQPPEYPLQVTVKDYKPTKKEEIINAVQGVWPFKHPRKGESNNPRRRPLIFDDSEQLCRQDRQVAETRKIVKAVWEANGEHCTVEVRCQGCILDYVFRYSENGYYEGLIGSEP